jgi:hypothetical protein
VLTLCAESTTRCAVTGSHITHPTKAYASQPLTCQLPTHPRVDPFLPCCAESDCPPSTLLHEANPKPTRSYSSLKIKLSIKGTRHSSLLTLCAEPTVCCDRVAQYPQPHTKLTSPHPPRLHKATHVTNRYLPSEPIPQCAVFWRSHTILLTQKQHAQNPSLRTVNIPGPVLTL